MIKKEATVIRIPTTTKDHSIAGLGFKKILISGLDQIDSVQEEYSLAAQSFAVESSEKAGDMALVVYVTLLTHSPVSFGPNIQ